MGRIIRQRPVPLSERAEGVVIEEQGGAVLVRSGGWPGTRITFDNGSELFKGESTFDAVDGSLIIRKFERLFLTFPENVGTADLELELFPCGIVSLVPAIDRGDPPVRVRFPVIEYTALELVAGAQPAVLFDTGAASEQLGTEAGRAYYHSDVTLGGFIQADEAFTVDVYAYRDSTWDPATALYVGGWSVIDNTVTNRAELCLDENGFTRSTDGIRMTTPFVIPPFGFFVKIRKTVAGDLHNLYARFWLRSR